MVAERTAVPAHLDAEATDFMMVGGIEQARQHNQHCGHVVHRTPSEGYCATTIVSPEFAWIAWFWQRQNMASGVGEGQPISSFPSTQSPALNASSETGTCSADESF